MRRPIRVYVDTSVFGGVFDEEFTKASRAFFRLVRLSQYEMVISALAEDELSEAPPDVRNLLDEMLTISESASITDEADDLAAAYVEAGVITEQWLDDALHVAIATVAGCSAIVSWNFRHIVHYQKIPRYNAVNALQGYPSIAIYSPMEMIGDEEEV